MTDKQIIIDGVDVSQCEHYSIKHNSCNHTISGSCIKENCQIFRLLQTIGAKEQECEELKAKIEYVFSDASPNFDYFCDICVAKDKCNGNCCFEQIKELIYEVE